MMSRLIPMITTLLLVGCAPKMEIDGFTVMKEPTEEAFATLAERAAFELDCPRPQLQLRILDVHDVSEVPISIGVQGCERRAVYVRPENTTQWILNSESGVGGT